MALINTLVPEMSDIQMVLQGLWLVIIASVLLMNWPLAA
jgi:hypothetical protein